MTVLPTFSIVVPTYRRLERLAVCLRSLETLDYPRDRFEVIVVDDGGNLPLPSLQAPIDVVLLTQPHAGPATARNTGAARARGTYLAFTDDDCRPDPAWLQAMAARVAQAPDHAIGGRTINALPHNPFSTATQLLIDFLYEWHFAHGETVFFTSNNLIVPAQLFRARGAFDAEFRLAAGEDREFCHRWGRSGGRFTYAPEALVRHEHYLDVWSFWRQHFTYGRGAFHFRRRLARAEHGIPVPTPLSFYMKLVAYPLRGHPRQRLFLALLLLLAQVATVAGYGRERLRREPAPALRDRPQGK
jgi:GT2 family glycosyltransferase